MGVCTTDEGNGVTELIAACAYNAIANGVGPFSFTHALIAKLRLVAQLPGFNTGFLYNAIFTEVQGWRIEDSRFKKAPIHLVLSQDQRQPRSIRLSKQLKLLSREDLFEPTPSSTQIPPLTKVASLPLPKEPASLGDASSTSQNSPFSQNLPSVLQQPLSRHYPSFQGFSSAFVSLKTSNLLISHASYFRNGCVKFLHLSML